MWKNSVVKKHTLDKKAIAASLARRCQLREEMTKCGAFSTQPTLSIGRGEARIATWNSRALFTANVSKRAKRVAYVKAALKNLDVLFIQETHGMLADVYAEFGEFLRLFFVDFSPGVNPATGGVLTFVRKQFKI
eukprot:1148880-Karenia_brevis.AAC.1